MELTAIRFEPLVLTSFGSWDPHATKVLRDLVQESKSDPGLLLDNVSVVIAAPYTGGILAMDDLSKDPKYMYRDAPPDIIAQAQRIKNVCDHHGVPMRAVALQFGLGHPAVASTVPGGRNGAEVRDNVHRVEMDIPDALWDELADEGLLPTNVPHR